MTQSVERLPGMHKACVLSPSPSEMWYHSPGIPALGEAEAEASRVCQHLCVRECLNQLRLHETTAKGIKQSKEGSFTTHVGARGSYLSFYLVWGILFAFRSVSRGKKSLH